MSTESEVAPIEAIPDSASEPHGLENETGANPEVPEPSSSGDDAAKGKTAKGVQKRLDELTRDKGELQRVNERLLALLERGGISEKQAEQKVETHAEPVRADYASHEDYLAARADFKVAQAVEGALAKRAETEQREKAQATAKAAESTWSEAVEKAKAKYDDFEDVAYADPKNGGPAVTQHMAEAIKTSDVGPEIAYWLGNNVSESKRIAALSPAAQAREIGKIEVGLANPKPAVKASKAPDPIEPLSGKSNPKGELRGDESMDEIYRSMFPQQKGRRTGL